MLKDAPEMIAAGQVCNKRTPNIEIISMVSSSLRPKFQTDQNFRQMQTLGHALLLARGKSQQCSGLFVAPKKI